MNILKVRIMAFAFFGAILLSGASALFASTGEPLFVVNNVSVEQEEDTWFLSARVQYRFSKKVREALESGVPITIELQVEVLKPRKYIWDKTIYEMSRSYRIEYHALTEQYVVTDLKSNVQWNYTSEKAAVAAMGVINALPIFERKILEKDEGPYYGRVRVTLDIGSLPLPLRLWAYTTSDWRISSEWVKWPLK